MSNFFGNGWEGTLGGFYWINLITLIQLNMSQRKVRGEQPSRLQIIDWINSTLNAGLSAIEQLGSGAIFCQLLLQAHPAAIPRHRINCNASTPYEFTANFRLLQNAFAEVGIDRPLDLGALVRAQYKDNFELAVWFYWYLSGQQLETDCTLSSQGQPCVDFSFARRVVTPKQFTPRRDHHEATCACQACEERGNWRLRQRVRELEAKFEMMAEVLESQEPAEEMCYLIEEIIRLPAI